MNVIELKYHPKDEPIPHGWVLSSTLPCHHGNYSVLIKREAKERAA